MMGRAGTYPSIAPKKPGAYVGMRTPWGKADNVRKTAEGIYQVSTPGHGGYKLGRYQNSCVHEAWRKTGGWYEEDIEWCIVVLTFQTEAGYSLDTVEQARKTAKDWMPDKYEAVYGKGSVTLEESFKLRERAEHEAAKGKLQIVAAWGDGAAYVPPGKVGVFATIDGERSREAFEKGRYFMVDADWYEGVRKRFVKVVPDDAPEVRYTGPVSGNPFQPR